MSTSLLLEMLRRSGLEHFYPSFSTRGISQLDSLVQLSMQDYNSLGVTSMEDRRKLFQLIQTIKAEYPDMSGAASAPAVAANPISHATSGGGIGSTDGSGYGATGVARGYSGHEMSDISAKPFDPRASVGRRSGSTPAANTLNSSTQGHSRNMSNSIASSPQQQQQDDPMLLLRHQQQLQQQVQQQYQQQQMQLQQQQQQYQQQQYQQQLLQLQQQQQQQQQQQRSQYFDGRNFKEASEDEEEPLPVQESKPRGLDSYSIPTVMGRNMRSLGRNAGTYIANDMAAKIRVCVRKRPLNSKEINKGEKDMATVAGRQLTVDEPKVRVDMTKFIERHNFVFDEVFDSDATNEDVYRRTAYPLVQYLFEGGKATCFAYGQTGSGKTFTMLDDKQGLYVLAARDIFVMLRKPENTHLSAFIGFYEIYQGQLYDLLNNRKKLQPREDGKSNVVISGLREYEIVNVQGLMQVFEFGNNARSTGRTNANADSSRSHAITQIVIKDKANKSVEGKLSFIDLAGSERGADRGETDVKTRMEGAEINKSLLALKECIRALDQDKKHTPFRQSKLTQVLKDSFVGNSRTCMVATISPNNSNSEHTLNTLRYADRVKELKAEGGAKSALQEQDVSSAKEEYMDDIESYGDDDLAANVYDDDYLSSDGENVADVTIDLLEDEEFPDLMLDQEEMSTEALAMNTYEHEFQEPQRNGHSDYNEKGGDTQSHLQQQPKQPQQQQLSQRNIVQQQQSSEPERVREPLSSKSPRHRERDPDRKLKGRKPEAISRLPMPRSFQQQSSSTSSSSIPTPQHRPSYPSRSNTSNTSPPLGNKTREPKSSPSEMATSPRMANDYISQKGSGSSSNNVTPNAGVGRNHPSVNTKHGHSSSISSNNNNGPASAGSSGNNNDLNNVSMASPTSPKVALVSPSAGGSSVASNGGNSSSTGGSSKNWSAMEMDEFLREHRNQLRDCGELTKRETKLLANVTLGMSSPVHAQSTGFTNSRESFMKYVDELDEIVDEKLITIVAMSQKLKALRGQA